MVSIAATGQLLLHEPLDFTAPGSARLKEFLDASDVAAANLEVTVEAPGAWPTKTKTLHLASPHALQSVRDLGFSVVSHANNHAFDLGPPGIAATHVAASAAGLQIVGSGSDLSAAFQPARCVIGARNVVVLAVDLGPQPDINYAGSKRAGIAPFRMRRAIAAPPDVRQMMGAVAGALGDNLQEAARRRMGYDERFAGEAPVRLFGVDIEPGEAVRASWSPRADDWDFFAAQLHRETALGSIILVMVHSHHWDPDWSRTPEWQLELSRRILVAGAHMIVGTGSPVLQPVSFHKGKPIFGGLGNCIFHTARPQTYDRHGVDVWNSAACRAEFDQSGVCRSVAIMPIEVGRPEAGRASLPPAPQALEGERAESIFRRMTEGVDNPTGVGLSLAES